MKQIILHLFTGVLHIHLPFSKCSKVTHSCSFYYCIRVGGKCVSTITRAYSFKRGDFKCLEVSVSIKYFLSHYHMTYEM